VDTEHPCIIAGFNAHQQVGMGNVGELTQHLRQLGGSQLARSTRAAYQLCQAKAFVFHTGL